MDHAQVKRIARKIFEANRDRERFRPLRGADAPPSMEAAYRVQDEVHRLFEIDGGLGLWAATRSR
jgi:2-keto-4-pentenoate hydratase